MPTELENCQMWPPCRLDHRVVRTSCAVSGRVFTSDRGIGGGRVASNFGSLPNLLAKCQILAACQVTWRDAKFSGYRLQCSLRVAWTMEQRGRVAPSPDESTRVNRTIEAVASRLRRQLAKSPGKVPDFGSVPNLLAKRQICRFGILPILGKLPNLRAFGKRAPIAMRLNFGGLPNLLAKCQFLKIQICTSPSLGKVPNFANPVRVGTLPGLASCQIARYFVKRAPIQRAMCFCPKFFYSHNAGLTIGWNYTSPTGLRGLMETINIDRARLLIDIGHFHKASLSTDCSKSPPQC